MGAGSWELGVGNEYSYNSFMVQFETRRVEASVFG